MGNRKNHYVKKVTEQVCSKEAKEQVEAELTYHLRETQKALLDKGLNEMQAEERAIEQMGSPVHLGIQLNSLYRPKLDWAMLTLFLLIIGFSFMPLVAMNVADLGNYTGKKIVMAVLGVTAAIGLMFFDYRKLKNLHQLFLGLGIISLILLNFLPTGMINGYPIIDFGPLSFQILHTLPIFFLFWASYLVQEKTVFWKAALLFLLTSALMLNAGGIAAFMIYSVMVFIMLITSSLSNKKIFGFAAFCLALIASILAIIFTSLKEYQLERFYAFLNPEMYSETSGYMYIQINQIVSESTWFGNLSDMQFIPSAHTDFILLNIIYHFGWAAALLLLIALTGVAVRMVYMARQLKDQYGKMLLSGGVALFVVQAIYNIGMIFGVLPLISMSLPLLSYGFWPTMLGALVVGIFLSVYRRKNFNVRAEPKSLN
ncbi:FtsW/RodA/SpoVE family cell cycle protein [Planococcus sp. NCCP-2050]|uniref:FtsW/RodA/SpoVE family cell cycle protein n=1 Tax=Planococcus sp. NCCP-2050 TaxID=2944679 RepID=UPI002041DAF3|nr:FtsW/RodA/SpoVE family cell cycle protein [Planococcus sp. NCCP-2050]GKW46675.1 cell division protein FtsW [Planococcus sp. NCCP-2050]